jgi:hypothetical protein
VGRNGLVPAPRIRHSSLGRGAAGCLHRAAKKFQLFTGHEKNSSRNLASPFPSSSESTNLLFMASTSVKYFSRLAPTTHIGGRERYLFRYRFALAVFIGGLVVSGLSAFPLQSELAILSRMLGISDPSAFASLHGLRYWIAFVAFGLHQTYAHFPFFGYASDWLAFGHLVIALFFFLPLLDPARYRGVLNIGVIACFGVFVIALICGPVREIPFYWRLIDCSFGLIGAIPLLYCLSLTKRVG